MQGNNYEKKLPKSRTKLAVRLKELPFTLQDGRKFVIFRFYFPLFIKLFAVVMCNL